MDLVETNFSVGNRQVLIYIGLRNKDFLYWNFIQNSVYTGNCFIRGSFQTDFTVVYMQRKTRKKDNWTSKMTELKKDKNRTAEQEIRLKNQTVDFD